MLCHNQVFYQHPEVTIIIIIIIHTSAWEPKHCQVSLEGLCKRDLKEKNEVQLCRSVAV